MLRKVADLETYLEQLGSYGLLTEVARRPSRVAV
jgi:hypothetical protein